MGQRRTETQMLRRFVGGQVSALSEYEIDVTVCTSTADALDGDVWVMEGVDLSRFLAHPIVLWDHDMSQPIGRASNLQVAPDKITARVTFPDEGISPKADEIRKLVKAGIVTGTSGGVLPTQVKPLDANNPRGGNRVTKSLLLEFSICAVPADATSGVTARSNGDNTVPQPTTETEDEAAAAATAAAAAAAAAEQGAAAPGADAGTERTAPRRRNSRSPVIVFKRGLYQVAQLCYLFEEIGYQADRAKQEAAIENDNSKVPAMLAAMLHDMGDILLAMTAEEVAEALAGHDVEPEDDDDDELPIEERNLIAAAKTPAVRAFRRGLAHAKTRAGKKLSAETVRCLRAALDAHDDATSDIRSGLAKQKKALGTVEDLLDGADSGDGDGADPETTDGQDDEAAAERSRRARAAQLKANALSRAD